MGRIASGAPPPQRLDLAYNPCCHVGVRALNIKGESYRLKEKRRAGLLGLAKPAPDEAEKEVELEEG